MRFRKSSGDQVKSILTIVPFLVIATMECTSFFESKLQWGKRLCPKNGSLDYQPGLSLEIALVYAGRRRSVNLSTIYDIILFVY